MIPYSMTTILRQKKRKHCNFEKSDFSAAFHLLRSTRTKTLIHRCVIEVGKMASESPEDSMWMDNLEEWVGDQNEVVTVKSLSRGLKVHVNVAKEMLFAFAEKKKEELELEVVYLVSGERGVRIARADKVGFSSFDFYATTMNVWLPLRFP